MALRVWRIRSRELPPSIVDKPQRVDRCNARGISRRIFLQCWLEFPSRCAVNDTRTRDSLTRDRIEHFDLDRLREMRAKTPGYWRNDRRNGEQARDEVGGGPIRAMNSHAAMLLTEALTTVSNDPIRHIPRFGRIAYAPAKSPASCADPCVSASDTRSVQEWPCSPRDGGLWTHNRSLHSSLARTKSSRPCSR